MFKSENVNRSKDGFTLVEVLASIAILTIIIMTFAFVYSQTIKTTIQSEEIIDGTYIAQLEMENIYQLKDTSFEDRNEAFSSLGYVLVKTGVLKKEKDNWDITLTWDMVEDSLLTKIVLQVDNHKEPKTSEVQMEYWMEWQVE